jgi:hypothetical protein
MLYIERWAFLTADTNAGILFQSHPRRVILEIPNLWRLKSCNFWKFINNQRIIDIDIEALLLLFSKHFLSHTIMIFWIVESLKVRLIELEFFNETKHFLRQVSHSLFSILFDIIFPFFAQIFVIILSPELWNQS